MAATLAVMSFCIGMMLNGVDSSILQMSSGGVHVCTIFDDLRMKCWGYSRSLGVATNEGGVGDSRGELGDNLAYFNPGSSLSIKKVYSGGQHNCLVLNTDEMKCFGNNVYGQVGIGSTSFFIGAVSGHTGDSLPTVKLGTGLNPISIALGYSHSCIAVTGNKVKCFGKNEDGQLGYENEIDRGASPSDMGDSLPYVNLGTNYEVLSVHSGPAADHTCAVFSQPADAAQKVKCWGSGKFHQLGYGNDIHRGDNVGEMGDKLTYVNFGAVSKVKQIVLGFSHTCALLTNDNLKCFGEGYYGQLGSGNKKIISSVGNSMPVVKIDEGKTIKYLTAGNRYTCIVFDDEVTLKCFGINGSGQLGIGSFDRLGNSRKTVPSKISAINLGSGSLKIASLQTGYLFNCVLFVDSSIKCFGDGSFGQLGIGSPLTIGDNPNEMGLNLMPAFIVGTESPTKAPTSPTKSPTLPTCKFANSKACNEEIDCYWKKKCVPLICKSFDAKKSCEAFVGKCDWVGGECVPV